MTRTDHIGNLLVGLITLAQVAEATQPDERDVSYGADPAYQVLDIYYGDQCDPSYDPDASCPVVVWWHPGGYTDGTEDGINVPDYVDRLTQQGITVVSAEHRRAHEGNWFCPGIAGQAPCRTETGADGEPLPIYNYDGALAVSFLKSNADLYNLDPDNIWGGGHSSGGGIAMWVAYHNDVFENDPSRPSSRLRGVATFNAQTNLDPIHHATTLEIFDASDFIVWAVHNYYGLCEDDSDGRGGTCGAGRNLDWQSLTGQEQAQYVPYFREGSADSHVDAPDVNIPAYFIYEYKNGDNALGGKDCADTSEDGNVQHDIHCPDLSVDHRQSMVELGIGCKFIDGYSGSHFLQESAWLINQITGDPNSISVGDDCYCAYCEGDANGDCVVDEADSAYVQGYYGCDVGTGDERCNAADVTDDGNVNGRDTLYIVKRYGSCEPEVPELGSSL